MNTYNKRHVKYRALLLEKKFEDIIEELEQLSKSQTLCFGDRKMLNLAISLKRRRDTDDKDWEEAIDRTLYLHSYHTGE